MWILDLLFGDPVTPEWLTVTLPITLTGAKVLLAMLGLILSSGLVWLMLNAPDRAERQRDLLTDALTALGWVLLPFWFLLLAGTLWHLWLLFSGLDSFLDNVGFGMGAVVAAFLGGPFVIWGAVLKHRTVEFQKEGHITERISKAVEQLGAEKRVKRGGKPEETVPNIEVRIGGLLSLERIAQDSTNYDKGRDHVRVMEILCAYVRENAPVSGAKDSLRRNWEDETQEQELPAGEIVRGTDHDTFCYEHKVKPHHLDYHTSVEAQTTRARGLQEPRADIAIALRIIGRRTTDQLRVEARWGPEAAKTADWVFYESCPDFPEPSKGERYPKGAIDSYKAKLDAWKEVIFGYRGYRPDLRNTNLQKADLSELTLSGARLNGARMEGADLREVRMEGANLLAARMEGADLWRARMEGADLSKARMEGADLNEARLTDALLIESRLDDANLIEARLVSADMSKASIIGANCFEARLSLAFLWKTWVADALLCATRLDAAYLVETELGAETSMRLAISPDAALQKIDLADAQLSDGQVATMFGDASVTLPEGLEWPKHWPTWELPISGDHAFHDEWRRWRDDPEGYEPPEPPDDATEQPAG